MLISQWCRYCLEVAACISWIYFSFLKLRNHRNHLKQLQPLTMAPESNNQSSNATGKVEKAGESSKGRGNGVYNPGRKSRNPYLNFLREFRRQNYHLSAVEVVRRGAAHWRQLTEEQKLPYVRIAFYAPMRPRRCPMCGMRYRMKRASSAQSSARKSKLVKSQQMRMPAKKQH
uniref:HMG box domain-containing protein n=1 Tax=Anopheles darlingi TaxID=43151 RepID=A0A2M4CVH4_ANODA